MRAVSNGFWPCRTGSVPPIGCRSWDRSCCEAQATLAERQVGDGKGCCWDGSRLQKFGEAACDGVIMGVGEGFGGTGR